MAAKDLITLARAYQNLQGVSGVDSLLSTLLTPICILASWESITRSVREYMLTFLILETMMVGMFCALDFVVFYVFFEGVLVPMFLIIGIWGGPRRVYSAFKFFLYTFAGSVLMSTTEFASWTGSGRSKSASARLKIALLAPRPRASERTARSVKPGDFSSVRKL